MPKRLRQLLTQPTGFAVKTMKWGFRFEPPFWFWLVLLSLPFIVRLIV